MIRNIPQSCHRLTEKDNLRSTSSGTCSSILCFCRHFVTAACITAASSWLIMSLKLPKRTLVMSQSKGVIQSDELLWLNNYMSAETEFLQHVLFPWIFTRTSSSRRELNGKHHCTIRALPSCWAPQKHNSEAGFIQNWNLVTPTPTDYSFSHLSTIGHSSFLFKWKSRYYIDGRCWCSWGVCYRVHVLLFWLLFQ